VGDEDLDAVIAAAFDRLRANLMQTTADPSHLQKALETLEELRSQVKHDPAWVRRILQQMERSEPES
jgi:hypothetical protein